VGWFLLRRLAHGAAVIFIAASLAFILVHLAPGDPFSSSLDNMNLDPGAIARWRATYGLDKPLPVQYVRFIAQVVTGNLGPSLPSGQPAIDALAAAAPRTLLLMGTSLVVSIVGGVFLGAWQATRRGSASDRIAGTVSLIVASLPEFWLGLVLILVFAVKFHVFPSGGVTDAVMYQSYGVAGKLWDRAMHLTLPALTLGLLGTASIARYQRAAVLDVLPQDFIRTARAKGVSERQVLWRHALRNALVPTVVLAGLSLPTLLGGAVFVERIFTWNGLGLLATTAFGSRDYHVVVGAALLGAVLVVVGGIFTDLVHAAIDPRIRFGA
jgi:peptide/nickel transport system permease protein